jgi:hypothetical protein
MTKLHGFVVARNSPSNSKFEALLPTLDAMVSMETFFVATLRAHFRFKDGLLTKRLHTPDDRVLDG